MRNHVLRLGFGILALLGLALGPAVAGSLPVYQTTASSVAGASAPGLAIDGQRFAIHGWRGADGATSWWWQAEFTEVTRIGARLQVVGDHEVVFRNAPRTYVWQGSLDGEHWNAWAETRVSEEGRLYRVHRLRRAQSARFVRLWITAAAGSAPTLREVEFYPEPKSAIEFPDWLVAVNTTHDSKLPGHGQEFIPLARSCAGWQQLQAQQVWLDRFEPGFLSAEPKALCAFLSGNFKDWCEVERERWRGAERVLQQRTLPVWASCGGAQGLALLAEYGTKHVWDCPHCRDAHSVSRQTPLYTHLGHTASRSCGDYSGCVFERGPHWIAQLGQDAAFTGLPAQFQLMESHCGQIERPPQGWQWIATAGQGTQTKIQCVRLRDYPIYAAQFHIEMAGTPENSRLIMSNFLRLAKHHPR